MEEGQSPSEISAHNGRGPNVSAGPRPPVARQALNQATTYRFGAPQAPASAAAITPRGLAEPPAATVGAAEAEAALAPAPAEPPLAAPPQQS